MKTRGFCAFCKSPKWYYAHKHLKWTHTFFSLLLALCFNYVATFEFGPSFLFIFGMNLIVAEMILQIRWRMSVICQKCGFDPVLYVKDQNLACNKVKQKLDERKKDEIKNVFFPLKLPFRKS